MSEHFPRNSQEHPTEAEIRAGLERKETSLREEAVCFLENMGPEKLMSKTASLLLASVLSFGSISAFASERGIDGSHLPDMGEDQIVKMAEKSAKKNAIADFDWQKISNKIEMAMDGDREEARDITPENINAFDYRGIQKSAFFRETTSSDLSKSYDATFAPLYNSQNSVEFMNNLGSTTQGFSDMQKAVVLQNLGAMLGGTYNMDMLNNNEHVTISDDAMFNALRNGGTSGICGNIHTYLIKAAASMGVEAWVQSGGRKDGDHVWAGAVLDNGSGKQITFLDYGTLLPTGTLNFRDAQGIAERYHGDVTTFSGFVGNESKIFFPVMSRAGEVVSDAMRSESSTQKLSRNLDAGEVSREERGLEQINTQEVRELKLNSNTLGFTFFNFKDLQNDPYQSIKNLDALRGKASFGGKNFGLDVGATVIHMNIKDLEGGTSFSSKIAADVAANYLDSVPFAKGEYGDFVLRFGATLDGALMAPLAASKETTVSSLDGKIDGALGSRLVYVNPENTGTFYVDASEEFRGQLTDLQNQKPTAEKAAQNIALGATVKVFEGKVVNMEVKKSDNDWGNGIEVKGGMTSDKVSGEVSYEKKDSNYERFVPSSQELKLGINYQGGPQWEVDVVGFKKVEQYKDAPKTNISNVGVTLKIMLW